MKILDINAFARRMSGYQGAKGAFILDVIAEPPYEKFSQDIVERYARELEAMIRAQPSGWLWSHRRWKFSRQDDKPTGDASREAAPS